MRIASLLVASLVFAVGCGRVESDLDSGNAIDGPAGNDGAGDIDGPTVDAPMGSIDAAIDATPIDAAPPTAPFDIAYTSRWTIINTTGIGASQVGLIVNKSTTGQTMDLNVPNLTVVSSTDDSAAATFTFMVLNPATYTLPAQMAGGLLIGTNATLVNPLVGETRFNTQRPTFDFSLSNIPIANATINASAVVRHGNQFATLNFVFTIQATGTSGGNPTAASRVSSVPM